MYCLTYFSNEDVPKNIIGEFYQNVSKLVISAFNKDKQKIGGVDKQVQVDASLLVDVKYLNDAKNGYIRERILIVGLKELDSNVCFFKVSHFQCQFIS